MLSFLLSAVTSPWTLAAGALSLLVCYAWMKTRLKHGSSSNIPPFPAPAAPFLGHTLLLLKSDLLGSITRMRGKAGNVFSLNLLGQHLIVVSGYAPMREVLTRHADKTQDRPVDLSSQILGEEDHGLMSSRGDNWKEQRATALSILRELGLGKNVLATKTEEEVAIYIERLSSLQGKATDFRPLISAAVSNIICSIVFGHRFDYGDEYFNRIMENLNKFGAKLPHPLIFYAATYIKKLPADIFGLKEWLACIDELYTNFICLQTNKIKESYSPDTDPHNFIHAYLKLMRQKQESGTPTYLDEPNLVSNVKSIFGAGTETTGTTINWCVLYCLHHPAIQDKVFQEIDSHVGTARSPRMSDMAQLPFLTAVIRETLRIRGVLPIMAREVTRSFQLQGYLIPEGSQIIFNLKSALMDPDTWENPDEFLPERFLDSDGRLVKPSEFIPFAIGRRVCPGESMALMELHLFLASMFQRFRFEPEDSSAELPSLTGIFGVTLSPRPYKVRFVTRAV
ncbi:hypothetical protein EGW08_019633 [Elysia chlorotica]|uniref:Cytochrome P450 n=1 Tax=Elysia chlorotica TaxID=188477 RepID=A0A433STW2_ELYCH|nr:hypothetical protein EGW08_019633 [Elysia chlorotica]